MPLNKQTFEDVWSQLRAKRNFMRNFLEEVRIQRIRGIQGLRVRITYPVSVIAGANGRGKSTLLFAMACAYKDPTKTTQANTPSKLFPGYYPKFGSHRDDRDISSSIEYEYSTQNGHISMRWRRGKSWGKSFFGRKEARQPELRSYLRTLSNLSNPSEVRGVLQMSNHSTPPDEEMLTPAQLEFAHSLLPQLHYREVLKLSSRDKDLLLADTGGNRNYSELHMAAGERVALRLALEVAQIREAIVLIDEVEAGLHPLAQQLLMLHLQRIALRNGIQVVVTSHSPAVLDCVPEEGRIFLERSADGTVEVKEPYLDLIQDALYGRSLDKLKFLCEDAISEAILAGVLDHVAPLEQFRRSHVQVGRNAGASEFAGHASAFNRFGLLSEFVFVLDGDQRSKQSAQKLSDITEKTVFLPGKRAPEIWIWDCLCLDQNWDDLSQKFGVDSDTFVSQLKRINAIYAQSSARESDTVKQKLSTLSQSLDREQHEICRLVAAHEATRSTSEIVPVVERVRDLIRAWRL